MYTIEREEMRDKPILLGITGNIASGKSAVRQYLENEGALTIDADLLAQSTYLPGGPAYQAILDTFGNDLRMGDGQINRSRLGRIAFENPAEMRKLEAIIHPLVTEKIMEIYHRADVDLVVIEAIKLFEAGIDQKCDVVWTVAADEAVRKQRLMNTRGLTEVDALRRIHSQSPQEEKISRSNYVIYTDSNFRLTYDQTMQGLASLTINLAHEIISVSGEVFRPLRLADFEFAQAMLARFYAQDWTEEDLLQSLSRHSILTGFSAGEITTLAQWKIELFIGLVQNIIPHSPKSTEIKNALEVLAICAREHLCQALYVPQDLVYPAMAKRLKFLPGDYFPKEVNSFAILNFLRKYGFMSEEVFVKTDL